MSTSRRCRSVESRWDGTELSLGPDVNLTCAATLQVLTRAQCRLCAACATVRASSMVDVRDGVAPMLWFDLEMTQCPPATPLKMKKSANGKMTHPSRHWHSASVRLP